MILPAVEQPKLSDFNFTLPESLIAQHPSTKRDGSRLMVLDRASGNIEHSGFAEIGQYLRPGDLLVINNTKVFPCRLVAKKPGGGNLEIFLLSEREPNAWNALVRGKLATGKTVVVAPGILAEIAGCEADGARLIRFHLSGNIRDALPEIGRVPLPPYITRDPEASDLERYQTIFAEHEGAVAAPTAGLHFTDDLIRRLKTNDIGVAPITLHVGPGTFKPVRMEVITEHRMMSEKFEISDDAAGMINRAKAEGRRVIAVGTTSVRAIESSAAGSGRVRAGKSSTALFIYPGYSFKITDALITNFHLPKSTLLILVSAFAGRTKILQAYREAVDRQYRFYSYGDAMLIC